MGPSPSPELLERLTLMDAVKLKVKAASKISKDKEFNLAIGILLLIYPNVKI